MKKNKIVSKRVAKVEGIKGPKVKGLSEILKNYKELKPLSGDAKKGGERGDEL